MSVALSPSRAHGARTGRLLRRCGGRGGEAQGAPPRATAPPPALSSCAQLERALWAETCHTPICAARADPEAAPPLDGFFDEAVGFYRGLVDVLAPPVDQDPWVCRTAAAQRTQTGLTAAPQSAAAAALSLDELPLPAGGDGGSATRLAHRALLCLGDLYRYAAELDPDQRVWSPCPPPAAARPPAPSRSSHPSSRPKLCTTRRWRWRGAGAAARRHRGLMRRAGAGGWDAAQPLGGAAHRAG